MTEKVVWSRATEERSELVDKDQSANKDESVDKDEETGISVRVSGISNKGMEDRLDQIINSVEYGGTQD